MSQCNNLTQRCIPTEWLNVKPLEVSIKTTFRCSCGFSLIRQKTLKNTNMCFKVKHHDDTSHIKITTDADFYKIPVVKVHICNELNMCLWKDVYLCGCMGHSKKMCVCVCVCVGGWVCMCVMCQRSLVRVGGELWGQLRKTHLTSSL